MRIEKKIQILNGQIEKLDSPDFEFRAWLSETKNLLDLVFEKSETKKDQLVSATQRPDYMFSGIKIDKLKGDWKKLIEAFRYELELLSEEPIVVDQANEDFINTDRIEQLRALKSKDFDFAKLIVICNELNSNFKNQNYISVTMLCRGLIDHIPPIFGLRTFNEVSNNYGSTSFKKNMTHLNNSMRNIADNYLHQTIRKKESLPNRTQIDFKNDIDVLLAEIIRIVE